MSHVIRVKNLSKQYYVGNGRPVYDTLRDRIAGVIEKRMVRFRNGSSPNAAQGKHSPSTIWALNNVNFEIQAGEVIGVVGRNGSGKSTLLKILSRITHPTSGSVEICGRSASLLEVGTGFHPELTGRENVYLNGAILGMSRAEIKQRFDEIVTFAEVEEFMNTPVKRFSTGMYLRLAFAVAAHLRTEILFIDEVLAVGDIEFQRKCLGKIDGAAKEGRTIMFVSHNLGAVTQLCRRALWLNDGRLEADGNARDVAAAYFANSQKRTHSWERPPDHARDTSDKEALLLSVRLRQQGEEMTGVLTFDQPFTVEVEYQIEKPLSDLRIVLRILSESGTIIFTSSDADKPSGSDERTRPEGRHLSVCNIPGNLLKPGKFFLTVGIRRQGIWTELNENVLMFEVGSVGYPLHPDRLGVITPLLEWDTSKVD
jgi:lipopolysaccharide transport system ATP-binding protein